jgi:filamentous hemagglutinin
MFQQGLNEAGGAIVAGTVAAGAAIGAEVAAGRFATVLDDLSRAAGRVVGKGGLTAAGRSLQEHAARAGSAFPQSQGTPEQISTTAQRIVDDTLTTPGTVATSRQSARFGSVVEVRAPDGRGLRFDEHGNFIHFMEP